jgi:hypothetical protein
VIPKQNIKVTEKVIKPLQIEKSNSQKDVRYRENNISKNNFAGRYRSPSPLFKKAHSKLKDKTPTNNLKQKYEISSANSYQTPNKSEKKIWHH